jgi:hypothetical protein
MEQHGHNLWLILMKQKIYCRHFWNEILGFSSWTNKSNSVHDTLGNLKTTVVKILNLTRVEFVLETLNLPQAKLYCSRLLQAPLICCSMASDKYVKIRANLHFARYLGDMTKWQILANQNTDGCCERKYVALPQSVHSSIDVQTIPFSGICGFKQFVPFRLNPSRLKNFILAASNSTGSNFFVHMLVRGQYMRMTSRS